MIDTYTSRKSAGILLIHILCVVAYYLSAWMLDAFLPASRYAYLFLVSIDDFKNWYPHAYPLVYSFIHGLQIVPYLFILFSFIWIYRSRLFRTWWLVFFYVASLLALLFFTAQFYWISAVMLLFMLASLAREEEHLWRQLSTRKTIVLFVLLALLLRIGWIFISDNNDNGDASARLYVADMWLRLFCRFPSRFPVEILNPAWDWLPLPFYLSGLTMFITQDIYIAPRILTALFGAFSVVPIFIITQHRLGRTVAIAASLIFVFYLQHIILSSQVLSECLYLFFLLWTYYFIEKTISDGDINRSIIGVSIALACCCLIRYEGWVFTGLVFILLPFARSLSVRSYLKLISFPLVAITGIMLLEVAAGQHPLRGILYSDYEVALSYSQGESKYLDILSNLPVAYLPLYFITMLVCFYRALQGDWRKTVPVYLLYWLTILPFLIKISNHTLTCQSRYLSIYMVPVIPFIAHLIVRMISAARLNVYTFSIVIIGYLILSNSLMAEKIKNNPSYLRYPRGFLNSAAFAKEKIDSCRLYVDYANDLSTNCWRVYSRTMDIQHVYSELDSSYYKQNIGAIDSIYQNDFPKQCIVRLQNRKSYNRDKFNQLIANHKLTHIMLFPEGQLNKELNFSLQTETYNGHAYERLFSENGYLIYKVKD